MVESSETTDISASARVLAVIPARYQSSRFPGKPLVDIQGKPMIQHVWDRVNQVADVDRVVVATDDSRIADAVRAFGGEVQMTHPEHPSGTDRVWEVAQAHPGYELVLNVQGDEPFLNPQALKRSIETMRTQPKADVVTLITPIQTLADWTNPNVVKAVVSQSGRALYFSRASIPFERDTQHEPPRVPRQGYRHLGLYLYRREVLARFTQLPPSPLEQLEKLEQLRALEAGIQIYTAVVEEVPMGIDTPEDLETLLTSLAKHPGGASR